MIEKLELGKLFEFVRNGASIKQEDGKDGIPITRIETIWNQTIDDKRFGYADIYDFQKYEKYLLEDGDILMTHINSPKHLGKCALYQGIPEKLIHGMNLLCLRPQKNKTDAKFISYYFNSKRFKLQLSKISNQSVNQASFSAGNLKRIQIPLPPLSTQKKIAAILDEADKLRQLNRQLIDKYNALSQSLFLDMFGDPVTNPKGWEKKMLSELCLKITDGTHHSPDPQKDGFPYVTAKHVKEFGLDFFSKPTYVSEKAHNEIYKRCSPEYGDVLYIKDGATTGIACINSFKEPISLLSSLALLKLDKEVLNNHYLCFWLNHKGIKEKLISEFMSGAAIQRYTLKKINLFKISIPPISLQNQFADRVQAIEKQKEQAQKGLEKAEELFNSLLQKAFKGELD